MCVSSCNVAHLQEALNYFHHFKSLNFTTEAFTQLILNPHLKVFYEIIKRGFEELNDLGFNGFQLIDIAELEQGIESILLMINEFAILKSLKLTARELHFILLEESEYDFMQSIIQYAPALIDLKIQGHNIYQLVLNHPNVDIFQKIHEAHAALKALNFTQTQLMEIFFHPDGINNIKAIQKNFNAMMALNINVSLFAHTNLSYPLLTLNALGFHANQILNIVNHSSHSLPYLLTIGFHIDEILKIISYHHILDMETISRLFQGLQSLGIQIEEIIQINAANPVHRQVSMLQQLHPAIPQENFAGLNLLADIMLEKESINPAP